MDCYYCQKNEAVDHAVINPLTRQAEPTCRVCEYEFELLKADTKKFSPFSTVGKLLMAGSVLLLILVGWKAAILSFLVGIALTIFSVSAVGRRAGVRDRLAGQFAKENGLFSLFSDRPEAHEITWCKNCTHFRKIKGWEGWDGLYRRDTMPAHDCLPCRILPQTEEVWARFFAVPSGQKRLYPTDCPCFERQSR